MDLKIFLNSIGGILFSVIIVSGLFKLTSYFPDHWLIVYCIPWIIILIVAYNGAKKFKLTHGEDGMVIYQDYYDIFKCLSIVGVPYVIFYIGMHFDQVEASKICAALYVAGMTLHICYLSAKINKFLDLPVVYLTKFSISIIWIISIIQILNPSGKNNNQRRETRLIATLVLLFLTPIIDMFVLNDEGKELIQSKFKGRRFKGAREIRTALNK